MRGSVAALSLLLACAACNQQSAPVEELADTAEELVAATATPVPMAAGHFAPRDTCSAVAGANEFRAELAGAIKRRDAAAFAALAADDIKLDFGGGAGREELRKRLDDKSWELWPELDQLMELGCSANKQGGITIPWYFDQDMGRIDAVSGWLVVGELVPVYAAPDPESEELAAISWNVVKLTTLDPERDYQSVELADKTQGFIATDKLRSLIDYRLIASSRNGRWRVTSFVAGD
jgi:hypothetical protein